MSSRELSQKEIAQLLGLTTRQIRNLEAEGMPHRAEGNRKLYPVPGAWRWYHQKELDRAVSEVQPTDYDEARAREMAARAEKAELEVKKMRGELVHVDDLEALYSQPLADLRSQLLALPGRVAAELPMDTVEALEIIERVVFEFMAELSEDEDAGVEDAA